MEALNEWLKSAISVHIPKECTGLLKNSQKILESVEYQRFIAELNTLSFHISYDLKTHQFMISNDLDVYDPSRYHFVLNKTTPTSLTPENISDQVSITSISKSPIDTLYRAIHGVYSPMFLKNTTKLGLNTKLQGLITELDMGLGSIIRKDLNQSAENKEESISILSVEEEQLFWMEISENGKSKPEKDRAVAVLDVIQPLKMEIDKINKGVTTLYETIEVIETIEDYLDDLWKLPIKPPYSQERMKNLLSLIAEKLIGYIQDLFQSTNIFSSQYIVVIFGPHPWNGDKFVNEVLQSFFNRLKEIEMLRSTHELLLGLLSPEERRELKIDRALEIFSSINVLLCNKYTEANWKNVVAQYWRSAKPIEQHVAEKLQSIFSSCSSQPSQLLREFEKYSFLIKREIISRSLDAEKETLLNQLLLNLKRVKTALGSKKQEIKGKNISDMVNAMIWSKQELLRIDEMDLIIENSISDPKFASYQTKSFELSEELRKFQKESLEEWSAEIMDLMTANSGENRKLALQQNGQLMELDYNDGKLRVNYSDRLVTLLREVRQLLALGFPVPAKIQQLADNAQKYYRHGLVLKQVSHFYNTIDKQMLPCQQAMMLDAAIEFERAVKSPAGSKGGSITWENPAEVENYITRLQIAAERLTSANRRLRKLHDTICENVLQLMSIDIIRNQHKWKDIIGKIRGIIASVQENGAIKDEHTITWRMHWDYQLYKALEYQYHVGLETINGNLPEIKVELVFKQQKLQFRPPFEEIRAKYYREMKKLINMPMAFRGFADGKIFSQMVDNNSSSLSTVYEKAENLFQNLSKVQDIFKDWVVLGMVDLDSFIEEAMDEVPDWENNFRMIKQKGKEAEQLPQSVKVDCITVSTAPVKATIDDHLQKLFDSLLHSLRKSIHKHYSFIEDFTSKGIQILLNRPQTLEEIGVANAKHQELSSSQQKIQHHFESAEAKNKLLRSVAGSGVNASAIQAKWNKLELAIESHELMVKEQVESLKGALESRKTACLVEIDKFSIRWNQLKPKPGEVLTEDNKTKKAASIKVVDFVKERAAEFDQIEIVRRAINDDCQHFGIQGIGEEAVENIKNDLETTKSIWKNYDDFVQELDKFEKEDWISFRGRAHLFEEYLERWFERIRSKSSDLDAVLVYIQKQVDKYKAIVPCLKFVRGDTWMSEHWGEMFRIVGWNNAVSLSDLTFGNIISISEIAIQKLDKIKELNNRANGEIVIREAIQELDVWGAAAVFASTEYIDAKGSKLLLIKDWREIFSQIGDNLSLLQSLKDSPYYKNFAERVVLWEQKLVDLDEYLRNLNTVQRKWVYLEPIFSRGSLPSEQHRFSRIDDEFRSIMQSAAKDPRIVSLTTYPGIKDTLVTLVDQLERCQKALNEFLEMKREKFARFYFIGDEDLLEILGQAKNPQVIQAHLKKLFGGVHSVQFDKDITCITKVYSADGETVTLRKPVQISDNVEVWLHSLSNEIQETLKSLLYQCLDSYDIFKYPLQILGVVDYLKFTSQCEDCIQSGNFEHLSNDLQKKLKEYTSFDVSKIKNTDEKKLIQLKVKSLILDIIHFIDVVRQVQKANVKSISDWGWKRQLRYYMNKEKGCVILMNDAEFVYTFEYQGTPPKLVHTPLTDKCYLTLTQAMASGFGGNPFGPAGTGKTESVKALGVLFGRQVLVFNCDEGIDYKSMGRIFVGLVKCGAWGCFDEFNRLEPSCLSAVSQQIQVIQSALKSNFPVVSLLGKSVNLSPNSGIFVTLNPAGKNYGGRQNLPDNLKQLFRSVAMTHPDNELIAEVMLLSEGFQQGKELGSKVVSVFTLCKQLLSTQQHYDWGLRPLKTTLWLAGSMLQEERKFKSLSIGDESAILVRAFKVNTLSKLTFADSKRFKELMDDIFPDLKDDTVDNSEFFQAMQETCTALKLEFSHHIAEKSYQFYQACKQKTGVVIVGPSGSGKSSLINIVKSTCIKLGQKIVCHTVNPKSIDRKALLGYMDIDTREWFDGVLTFASREAVKQPQDVTTWIVCDGDVDPEWIESLNSVLDDNRLLTMPNGERIQFGRNINFIFETDSLKYASPATVSRMGMIYLSEETLDLKLLIKSKVSHFPPERQSSLSSWIDEFFFKSIDYIYQNCEFVIPSTKTGLVLNGFSQLHEVSSRLSFLFSLVRGLGANLQVESRINFANELIKWAGETGPPEPKKILDFFVNKNDRLEKYQLKEPLINDLSQYQDPEKIAVVETLDVKRAMDVLMPWIMNSQPILLVGPDGSGKNMILRHCFGKLRGVSISTIHCSAQTRSLHVLQRLAQNCICVTTTSGRVLRPKEGERLILYLKDINLPKPDKYETVELIQFLQQLLTYMGYFDSNLEWVGIENIQIVASMNPTSMGRHKLPPRFSSIVRQFALNYTDREQLQTIYRVIAEPVIASCLSGHKVWGFPKSSQKLATTMVNIFEGIVQKFTVDIQPHYIFTPRDISRWLIGISRYQYLSDEPGEVLDTLAYEAQRLFMDRLINNEHRQKFLGILSSVIQNEWNYSIQLKDMFFMSTNKENGARIFKRMVRDDFQSRILKAINSYERDVKDLNLCLFPEMLETIGRVERVLSQPGGSLLLPGRPGVGRSSAVSVAAHMLGFQVISPSVGRSYTIKHFSVDIKQAMQVAGVQGEDVVLLVEDYQIAINASFLEYLNSLLSGGDIPGLYSQEEMDQVLSTSLKDSHSDVAFRGSLYEYFISRVRKHLHIILLLDCSGPNFILNCESNPALYSRCTINWMESWSLESMSTLAKTKFDKDEQFKEVTWLGQTLKLMLQIHLSLNSQSGAVTPRHFIQLIETYRKIFCKKKDSLIKKQKYLAGGLTKLRDAVKYVDALKQSADIKRVELDEKQRQADLALKQITESMMKAEGQKKEMEKLSRDLNEEEKKLELSKNKIEKELSEVEPIVKASQDAVGGIKQESLTEIRSLRAPPPAIRDVLEGVLRLMGNLDMSWNNMKGFLGKRTVKDEIMNFDARNISIAVRESVEQLIKEKRDSFEEANIKRVSLAAAPLAAWVQACIRYSKVLQSIGPMEAELARLTKVLDVSREKVKRLQNELSLVDVTVNGLRENFGNKTREAETLRNDLEQATSTINSAQELLEKLSSENQRWSLQIRSINDDIASLPQNSLLAAAFTTYLGGCTEDVRARWVQEWRKFIISDSQGQSSQKLQSIMDFDFLKVMSTESEQLVWKSEGLPADTLSMENSVVIQNTSAVPLIVDPSRQAAAWLKVHIEHRKPETINQHDENFMRSLELAIRFGKTLIIQEVTEIEPVLYPLLRKDLSKQGPRFVVQLGDKTIDYHDEFRLYLISNKSIPGMHEACSLINETNFTVTRQGLAGQLLSVTLKNEKPELEIEKIALLKKEDELKLQLSSLEDLLLKELANSEGNLLENKGLISSLNETKEKSNYIASGLAESQQIQANLNSEREKFAPLSIFGSALYFVVTDLMKINNMYRFSLNQFLKIFEKALRSDTSTRKEEMDLRIKLLISTLEKMTYRYISRSILKVDRPMFALHLVHELHKNLFEENEWEAFTEQILVTEIDEKGINVPSWVPQELTMMFKSLQTKLPNLVQTAGMSDVEAWSRWIKRATCELEFNSSSMKRISPFQKLLIIQKFRPDRLMSAMNNFVCSVLGIESLAPPTLNIKKIYEEESICTEPILFITTAGTDPSQELRDVASQTIGIDKFHEIAMGQGQSEAAISKLRECALSGGWLCLQNVHLVTNWLSQLEKELGSIASDSAETLKKIHPNFRLWLTSEVHPKFPASLLQNCLKISIEAPPGLKKNLLRTYENWSPEFIQKGSIFRAQALFALAWFHAVLQERRTFIPQGWTKFYEFSASDLRSTAAILSGMCEDGKPVSWSVLHGLIENAIYGGRLDDSNDVQKLRVSLSQIFNDDIFSINGRQPTRKLGKGITLPNSVEHSAYLKLINELPENDNVTFFGLPENIDRAFQQSASSAVLAQFKVLKQMDSQDKKFEKEKWAKELMPFLQLWKKLNTGNDIIQKKIASKIDPDPLQHFFEQELRTGISLAQKVHIDLSFISKVIRGTALMTPEISKIGAQLCRSETPSTWLSSWEGSENPSVFLSELISKSTAVNKLHEKTLQNSNAILMEPVKLSDLFNPTAFLNAFRQHTSRKLKKSMDSLQLVSSWTGSDLVVANMQVIKISVSGLLIQGANFDGIRLSEVAPNDLSFAPAPNCYLAWMPKSFKFLHDLEIPLYLNSTREKIVTVVQVPSSDNDRSKWIMASVAFFTAIQ
ncbi:Cytoplasmic dynein 2 heavy chain 1 [Nowakowskiella sp. JEL0407]|nr:Cytoplasmic dynein 2 heavy chain 1 [Nowakowskiella sp. JEL0407]